MSKRQIIITLSLILTLLTGNTWAENANSIVVDDVEYYIQTDRLEYDLGEDVEMLYKITNIGSEAITFNFSYTPEWNFWVKDDNENLVFQAVTGWWTMGTSFTLQPNDNKDFPHTWDMKNSEGNLVELGAYTVIGGLDANMGEYGHTQVPVGIDIIPEPTSAFLLFIGVLGIIKRNRK
jgi:Intracellular proteinase inhibitor